MSSNLTKHINTLASEVDRAVTASTAAVSTFTREAAQRAAAQGTVRQILTLQVNTANKALSRFVEALYDREGRYWLSVSMADARIQIPAPWSRTRHRDYGLTDRSHRVLREWIWAQQEREPDDRLWLYHGHYWYLNVRQYRTLADAQQWLAEHKVTLTTWIEADAAYQTVRVRSR